MAHIFGHIQQSFFLWRRIGDAPVPMETFPDWRRRWNKFDLAGISSSNGNRSMTHHLNRFYWEYNFVVWKFELTLLPQ